MGPSKHDKSKEKGKEKSSEGDMKPPPMDNAVEAKMPPAGVAAKIDSGAIKPSLVSPPRGRRTKAEIMRSRTIPPGWYIRSALVQGGLEVITITTNTMLDDAYFNNLIKEINEGPEDGPIRSLALLGAFGMRVSLANPEPLMNKKSAFQRKAFIRVLDEGEMDDDTRLAGLKVIKKFLEEPRNNLYKTQVYIEQPGWNITLGGKDMAPNKDMPKLDHFLQYAEIIKVINKIFENVNPNWASDPDNLSAAECYFTEGHIPFEAMKDLGFPVDKVVG
jgi:hypothetical protein